MSVTPAVRPSGRMLMQAHIVADARASSDHQLRREAVLTGAKAEIAHQAAAATAPSPIATTAQKVTAAEAAATAKQRADRARMAQTAKRGFRR